MIRIPVSDTAHAQLTRASRWLCAIAFVGIAAVFSISALGGYRQAQAILKDAVTVQVPVQLDNIEEQHGRRGRVTHDYHFRYRFEANGVAHDGRFTTSEANAAAYLGEQAQVTIAYARNDPSRFERVQRLQNQKGLGAVLGRLLVALALMALLMFVVHLLLTRKLFVRRALPATPLS